MVQPGCQHTLSYGDVGAITQHFTIPAVGTKNGFLTGTIERQNATEEI